MVVAVPRPLLILVGLPGSGKTTVGRAVAQALDWPFADFDEEIQRREGETISEIFRTRGEEGFRALELALTRELAGCTETIVAPGGGWVSQPEAMALLRPASRMIYLRVSPEAAMARMGAFLPARPLLEGGNPLERLRRLYDERSEQYGRADLELDTEVLDLQAVIDRVQRYAVS